MSVLYSISTTTAPLLLPRVALTSRPAFLERTLVMIGAFGAPAAILRRAVEAAPVPMTVTARTFTKYDVAGLMTLDPSLLRAVMVKLNVAPVAVEPPVPVVLVEVLVEVLAAMLGLGALNHVLPLSVLYSRRKTAVPLSAPRLPETARLAPMVVIPVMVGGAGTRPTTTFIVLDVPLVPAVETARTAIVYSVPTVSALFGALDGAVMVNVPVACPVVVHVVPPSVLYSTRRMVPPRARPKVDRIEIAAPLELTDSSDGGIGALFGVALFATDAPETPLALRARMRTWYVVPATRSDPVALVSVMVKLPVA